MPAIREIQPGIFLVRERGGWGPLRPQMNIYVLTGDDGLVYDAGYGTRGSVRHLAREVRRIENHCRDRGEPCSITRVLPSHVHPDHFSGLAGLREEIGLRILLTRRMAATIRSRDAYRDSYRDFTGEEACGLRRIVRERITGPAASRFYEALYGTRFVAAPDEIIGDSGAIAAGGRTWRVIATPGHSPDHLSLYDEASGVLLGGDNVLSGITTWLGPPKSDIAIYLRTLERLRALPGLRLILGAHGGPVEDPGARIAEIIQWRARRLEHVYDAVRASGSAGTGKREVIRALYRGEGFMKRFMADGWIDLSLRCLIEDGRIRELSPGRYGAGRSCRQGPASCTQAGPTGSRNRS